MKKISIILFLLITTYIVNGQYTTPRYGILPGQDNTGRALNYNYQAIADAAGNDSITIAPTKAWKTIIKVSLADSVTFKVPSTAHCYLGDEVEFIIKLTVFPSGWTPKVKFISTLGWITAGTLNVDGSTLRAVIAFMFDGQRWLEKRRSSL